MTRARIVIVVFVCVAVFLVGCGAYVLNNLRVDSTPTKCTIDEVRLGKCR